MALLHIFLLDPGAGRHIGSPTWWWYRSADRVEVFAVGLGCKIIGVWAQNRVHEPFHVSSERRPVILPCHTACLQTNSTHLREG